MSTNFTWVMGRSSAFSLLRLHLLSASIITSLKFNNHATHSVVHCPPGESRTPNAVFTEAARTSYANAPINAASFYSLPLFSAPPLSPPPPLSPFAHRPALALLPTIQGGKLIYHKILAGISPSGRDAAMTLVVKPKFVVVNGRWWVLTPTRVSRPGRLDYSPWFQSPNQTERERWVGENKLRFPWQVWLFNPPEESKLHHDKVK